MTATTDAPVLEYRHGATRTGHRIHIVGIDRPWYAGMSGRALCGARVDVSVSRWNVDVGSNHIECDRCVAAAPSLAARDPLAASLAAATSGDASASDGESPPSLVCGHAECVTGLPCRRTPTGAVLFGDVAPPPCQDVSVAGTRPTSGRPLADAARAARALRRAVLAECAVLPAPRAAWPTSGDAEPPASRVAPHASPLDLFGPFVPPHPSHAWLPSRSGLVGVCPSCGTVTGFVSAFLPCTGGVPRSPRDTVAPHTRASLPGDTAHRPARTRDEPAFGVPALGDLVLSQDELERLAGLLAGAADFGIPVAVRVHTAIRDTLARITAPPA